METFSVFTFFFNYSKYFFIFSYTPQSILNQQKIIWSWNLNKHKLHPYMFFLYYSIAFFAKINIWEKLPKHISHSAKLSKPSNSLALDCPSISTQTQTQTRKHLQTYRTHNVSLKVIVWHIMRSEKCKNMFQLFHEGFVKCSSMDCWQNIMLYCSNCS